MPSNPRQRYLKMPTSGGSPPEIQQIDQRVPRKEEYDSIDDTIVADGKRFPKGSQIGAPMPPRSSSQRENFTEDQQSAQGDVIDEVVPAVENRPVQSEQKDEDPFPIENGSNLSMYVAIFVILLLIIAYLSYLALTGSGNVVKVWL